MSVVMIDTHMRYTECINHSENSLCNKRKCAYYVVYFKVFKWNIFFIQTTILRPSHVIRINSVRRAIIYLKVSQGNEMMEVISSGYVI